MKRRSFIKSASALSIASMAPLSLPNKDFKIGLTKGLFERSGIYSNPDQFQMFKSFSEAVQALHEDKIYAFVSSSFFASNYAPELTLFGSFPTAFTMDEKHQFIKNSRPLIENLLNSFNLKSDLIGVMSNEQIRFSKLSANEIMQMGSRFDGLVTAASGARALWMADMGFKVHQHDWASSVFENLLFLNRHDLQLTESHSPLAFLNALKDNDRIGAAEIEKFVGMTVFKDQLSYAPVPVEIFYKNKNDQFKNSFGHIKKSITLALSIEASLRGSALSEMKSLLNLNVEELPSNLKTAIAKRARAHLYVIANYSPNGQEAVLNFYNSGGVLNV